MSKDKSLRREPLTDTMLLMTIAICIFVVMYALSMVCFQGGFLRVQQVFDILNDNAPLLIVGCGLTIVMIGGGIDISVGAIASLVAMSCALFINNTGNSGLSIFLAFLLAIGIGLAFGLLHGFLISYLEIQPFIITLAGMFLARGLTTILSVNPQKVDVGTSPDGLTAFGKLMSANQNTISVKALGYTAGNGNVIPARMELGVVVAILCIAVIFVLTHFVKLGRGFYAIGGNQTSALMLGINVKRTRFFSYIISGILSGIAGFVLLTHSGAGNATNAAGMEMNAIAAAIIGGTLLTGGVGNVIGTFFGVLILATTNKIVVAAALTDPWWQKITTGGMLCLFILMQSIILSFRTKRKSGTKQEAQ